MRTRFSLFTFLLFVLVLVATACNSAPAKPTVVINTPPHGSQFREGEDVSVQSTATDAKGITRVELLVDGALIRSDAPPNAQGQSSFSLVQTWKATQGTHTVSVRAFNASNVVSDLAVISISVAAASIVPTVVPVVSQPTTAAATPIIAPTTAPTQASSSSSSASSCTNNAAFVADVTVPDGTAFVANQAFNKIWRVKNTGTCAWGNGYAFSYIGGESMAVTTTIAVPNTAPGATADLLVAMAAPAATGPHSAQWRLKAPGGAAFGTILTVVISVVDLSAPQEPTTVPPTPVPSSGTCSGAPAISTFTVSPTSLFITGNVTLSWGEVTNADSVEIDQGVGGVGTPGSVVRNVAPNTTFTLTARCGANTATRQVTVGKLTVMPPVIPIPPTTSQQLAQVSIGAGTTGSALATCPSGSVVTGGGYATNTNDGFSVYNSSKDGNGWRVYARNTTGASQLLNSYAICLANSGGTSSQSPVAQVSVGAGGTNNATASCPAGSVVTGGGFALGTGEEVYTQYKSGNGWQVYAFNGNASSQLLNAYAICLSGTSATTSQSPVQQVTVGAGGNGSATATCSSGIITAGGFASTAGTTTKVYTHSKTSGNAWQVYLHNGDAAAHLLNAYAMCASF